MNEPPLSTEEPEAISGERLYLRWLEWVTINLGPNGRRAATAAQAAIDATLQGAGFDSAADAARKAWLSDATSPKRQIDWPRAIGHLFIFIGSITAAIAVVGALVILFISSQCSGMIVCPDMCGGAATPSPTSSAGIP